MTCLGKVFLIFHDSRLGACESVMQNNFPTSPGSHPFSYSARSLVVWSFSVNMKFLIPLISKGCCIQWRKIKPFYKQIRLTSSFTCVHWKDKHPSHIWICNLFNMVAKKKQFCCQIFSYWELFLMYIFLSHFPQYQCRIRFFNQFFIIIICPWCFILLCFYLFPYLMSLLAQCFHTVYFVIHLMVIVCYIWQNLDWVFLEIDLTFLDPEWFQCTSQNPSHYLWETFYLLKIFSKSSAFSKKSAFVFEHFIGKFCLQVTLYKFVFSMYFCVVCH